MSKECTTHHFACACREEKFEKIEKVASRIVNKIRMAEAVLKDECDEVDKEKCRLCNRKMKDNKATCKIADYKERYIFSHSNE